MSDCAGMKKRDEIGVLYGFRTLMVLFVANFHIWQQGWLGQTFTLFGKRVSYDYWTRASYQFVDGMLLLSGFLLALPYVRTKDEKRNLPSIGSFYRKRLVRILPSYLLSVFVMLFCVAIPQHMYSNSAVMVKDVLMHLSFTFLFSSQTYQFTPLNVGLWTIAVEMRFYLLFPFVIRLMLRHPAKTCVGMIALGWLYRYGVLVLTNDSAMFVNQMPSFLDVYALGFLCAIAYVRLSDALNMLEKREKWLISFLSLAAFLVSLAGIKLLLQTQARIGSGGQAVLQRSQMVLRFPWAFVLAAAMLSACFMPRLVQKLLDNRLMRFLSTVSMNFYIWHQVLSVELRKAWFADVSLLHSDVHLQKAYTALCFALSLLAAMVVTYGFEQPITRFFTKKAAARQAAETADEA